MTNKALETTQNRISTGYRVAEASDNAAYWSIATTMRSDNKALGTVQDALGLGAAKVDVAYTGINAAIEVVDEIKTSWSRLASRASIAPRSSRKVAVLQQQLIDNAGAASFSGENCCRSTRATLPTPPPSRSWAPSPALPTARFSVGTIDVDITSTEALIDAADQTGILDKNGAAFTTASITTLDVSAASNTDIDKHDHRRRDGSDRHVVGRLPTSVPPRSASACSSPSWAT